MAYDPTSDDASNLVRLLITDTDNDNPMFSDDQIGQFLYIGSSGTGSYGMAEIRLAGSYALRAMAANQVMVMQVGKFFDLQIDGSKVSAELRAYADTLQALAFSDNSDGGFAIAEMVLDTFTLRERIWKEALRLDL